MTRAEFIARLGEKFGHLPADEIDAAVLSIIDRLSLSLQNGERIEIRGFGGFSLHHRQPRIGRNPKTGEAVALPAMSAIHFRPGKELREMVNNAPATERPSLPIDASSLGRP
jgi:integration host factor subunit beta